VKATVTSGGSPAPGVLVSFSVTNGPNAGTASPPGCSPVTCQTDANGEVSWTYTSNGTPGTDTIRACFTDGAGTHCTTATKKWTASVATKLTLTPKTATNTVDTQHCVTATVTDAGGNPVSGVTVRFSVSGSVTTSGSGTTGASGQATFCYNGPSLPGSDAIHAYADTDNDTTQDPGEPFDDATKQWVAPATTAGCKVTNGGGITAANGDKANFGGNAQGSNPPKGQEEYQDKGPATPMNVHSINVRSVSCSADGKNASIFGQAQINGSGSYQYRIDVQDNGEPGVLDTYRIRLSNGYDSGTQVLSQGNIQIHL
jgi:adhesin/invasin